MYRLDPLKGKPRPVVEENHGQSVVHTRHQKKGEGNMGEEENRSQRVGDRSMVEKTDHRSQ